MAKELSEQEQKRIVNLYKRGYSYRDIIKETGYFSGVITSLVKGTRTHAEACKLARKNGKGQLTAEGRKRLSENGKRACQRNKKYWTKPEQEFKKIVNEMGLGVRFPEDIQEALELRGDEHGELFFQYPIQRYVCDFVDIKLGIVFRVNGDFWHANPILYNQATLTVIQKNNVRQDRNCRIFLEKKGWVVCDVWESEIYWNKAQVRDKIRATREQGNPSALHAEDARSVTEVAQSDWSDKLRKLWFKKPRKKETEEIVCKQCGTKFQVSKHNKRHLNRKYCGNKCAHIPFRKVEQPSKERLEKEIAENSWKALGRKYGVSDNAVRKWAKQHKLL